VYITLLSVLRASVLFSKMNNRQILRPTNRIWKKKSQRIRPTNNLSVLISLGPKNRVGLNSLVESVLIFSILVTRSFIFTKFFFSKSFFMSLQPTWLSSCSQLKAKRIIFNKKKIWEKQKTKSLLENPAKNKNKNKNKKLSVI
jgi:hypothetical protein